MAQPLILVEASAFILSASCCASEKLWYRYLMAGVALLAGTEYRLLISWAASVMRIGLRGAGVGVGGGMYISEEEIGISLGIAINNIHEKAQMRIITLERVGAIDVTYCKPDGISTYILRPCSYQSMPKANL